MTSWRLADRVLEFPPSLAVGIVNVSADSFFEGARNETPESAVEHGLAQAEAGFDLIDVGAGARARPGGGGAGRPPRGAGHRGHLPARGGAEGARGWRRGDQ